MIRCKLVYASLILFSFLVISCSPLDRWTINNHRIAKAFHHGQYRYAITTAHQALALARTHFHNDPHYISVALNNLIFLYRITGHYQNAQRLLYQMLTIKELELGPTHPQISLLLLRLSEMFRFEGNYQSAALYGHRAVVLIQHQFPDHHPLLFEALDNLAATYTALQQHDLAKELYHQLLRLSESELGTQQIALRPYLANLEKIYRLEKKYQKALIYSKRVLALTPEMNHAGPNQDYSQALLNLGTLYFETKQYQSAVRIAQQLITYNQKVFGKIHPQTAISLDLLSQIYMAQKKLSEAESLLRRAWSIQQAKLPPHHPQRKQVFQHYAKLLTRLEKEEELSKLKALP